MLPREQVTFHQCLQRSITIINNVVMQEKGSPSEDAIAGWKKRGVENLTNDTSPKKGFWTPPCTVRFPPLSGVSALFFFSCAKIHDRADQKLF